MLSTTTQTSQADDSRLTVAPEKVSVTILVPAYNEESRLEANMAVLVEYLRNHLDDNYKWDVLLVNDGSADRTPEIANELA